MTTIVPGTRLPNGFVVLSLDPAQKRAVVACPCRGTHVFSCEVLQAGSASCPAIPVTRSRAATIRAERENMDRQRELRNWKPGNRA
jgi:hypothetical protein